MATTTVYVIGRCPHKGCRNYRRNTFPGTIRSTRMQTWAEWTLPSPAGYGITPTHWTELHPRARASACLVLQSQPAASPAAVTRAADIRNFAAAMAAVGWICADHDRFMDTRAVAGVYNADRRCNARCTGAYGHDCECACTGANHGADHDPTTT